MFYFVRENQSSVKKLRKSLSNASKKQTRQRINLNIQITFLNWLMEFFGFFFIFLGSFILGHKNAVLTLCLQILTVLFYYVLVPSMYLINGDDCKDRILSSNLFNAIDGIFHHLIMKNKECNEEQSEHDDVGKNVQNMVVEDL
jgi:predicted permease